MQASPQAPLPLPVPQPKCLVWYPGDPCDRQLQDYRLAIEHARQQEWQNAVTARWEGRIAEQQREIAEQQAQIKLLQTRIESKTADALRSEARTQAFSNEIGVILGIALAFFVVVASFRKLTRASNVVDSPKAERSRAASA
jgi:hypothetical protein